VHQHEIGGHMVPGAEQIDDLVPVLAPEPGEVIDDVPRDVGVTIPFVK
jgi:hypothetical protein